MSHSITKTHAVTLEWHTSLSVYCCWELMCAQLAPLSSHLFQDIFGFPMLAMCKMLLGLNYPAWLCDCVGVTSVAYPRAVSGVQHTQGQMKTRDGISVELQPISDIWLQSISDIFDISKFKLCNRCDIRYLEKSRYLPISDISEKPICHLWWKSALIYLLRNDVIKEGYSKNHLVTYYIREYLNLRMWD